MQTNDNLPISIRKLGTNGLIMEGVVDEFMMPDGAVSYAVNLSFDKIGSAVLRQGLTLIGSQISDTNSIVGLHQFLDTGSGTNDRLIAVASTKVWALVSGVWTEKRTTLTSGAKARFTNFVDLAFMVNGSEAMQSWDGGAGNFSTTNVSSAPVATFIDNFRTRVWAAKTSGNPSRVYYSSVADSSGAITWTSTDFIDVAPGDGEDITAIKNFSRAMHVFKNNYIYRIFSVNESEPDPQIFVGTYSQESVCVAKDGMYWHHPSGIYRMRRGENNPVEISRPVYDIIKNVSRSYYDDVASWNDDDHVMFALGDVTVNGVTISNCVLRWTISSEVWTIYSYAQAIVIGTTYDTGTAITRAVGDNDGNVYTFDSGSTDNGSAINYSLETRWHLVTGMRSDFKTIRKIAALHEGAQGAQLGWRNGNMGLNEIQPIGSLKNQETFFDNLDIKGHRFKLSIRGASTGGIFTFQGWEVLDWINEGVIN